MTTTTNGRWLPVPGRTAGIRTRVIADMPALAPAQRRLATYLLENIATASDLSITDLAEEAEVSIGTISALCRRLGLRGYQDLRLGLAREAVTGGGTRAASGIGAGESGEPDAVDHGIARVFGAASEALAETASVLDRAAIEQAVDLLKAAGRVEWVGVGTAGLVAAEGALKLRKLGINAVAHFDGHQQAMSAALLGPSDVLVAVSHSGRTTDIVACVRVAREAGDRHDAITGLGRSPVGDLADVLLPTVSNDTAFQVEPMASAIAELAVVQLLFLILLERGGSTTEERLARTQKALEDRHLKGRIR
jgi:RpiR family carbohydrate utilization transcriptional regulator